MEKSPENNKLQEASYQHRFLEYVVSFVMIFSVIFAFKYFKVKMFPSKQALFFKEIVDFTEENKDKDEKPLISEVVITKGKENRQVELFIRKSLNLKIKLHNKFESKANICGDEVGLIFKHMKKDMVNYYKMNECANLYKELAAATKDYTKNQAHLLSKVSDAKFKQEYSKSSNEIMFENIKFYKSMFILFKIFSHESLYNFENEKIVFEDQRVLDAYNKNLTLAQKQYNEIIEDSERSLAEIKKLTTDKVEIKTSDIALGIVLSIIKKR